LAHAIVGYHVHLAVSLISGHCGHHWLTNLLG
jgi:hypothetical protein